jgi:hypothetical protein
MNVTLSAGGASASSAWSVIQCWAICAPLL